LEKKGCLPLYRINLATTVVARNSRDGFFGLKPFSPEKHIIELIQTTLNHLTTSKLPKNKNQPNQKDQNET
jgi:hypothetical protein